ncbi:MAG TPA: hypothetical protein PLE78_03350 [Flavobacteriales bacterium]|jgi:hypothetical protein|nr:hypothetical protein [Flavobacteriales bacterium]HQW40279.1 hypothetical protein [Flavobacteriales bacterium]
MRLLAFSTLLLLTLNCSAQGPATDRADRTGKVYVYWGWNRAIFTDSDIHFTGDQYDFTLRDVKAFDRPTDFNAKTYLSPVSATIPQYNFRIGYWFKPNWNISIGTDHMKYVVQAYQVVDIDGSIAGTGTRFDGNYSDADIALPPDFLQFEHTDGLNYPNVEIRHALDLLTVGKVRIGITEGIGTGILYPKTNVVLMNNERNDRFHLAGYGVSAVVGLQIEFFRSFFIQTEAKGGYIRMPDIRTTTSKADKADQRFFFGQWNLVLGASFGRCRKPTPSVSQSKETGL